MRQLDKRSRTPAHERGDYAAYMEAQAAYGQAAQSFPGLRDTPRLETALHKAVLFGNLPLACELVRAGSSLNVVNSSGSA